MAVSDVTPPAAAAAKTRPSVGLALGGGIARGWAHIGVIEALVAAGIEPDVIVGSSIGALVGGCHLSGNLQDLKDWALALNRRRLLSYLDLRLGGGVLAGDRLAKKMKEHLGDIRIEDLPKPFAAVCAELATGHEVWLREGELVPAIRASYALPGAFTPINVDGRWLIDGALVNPIPVSVCRALGARVVIAVGLHGDAFGSVITTAEDLEEDENGDPIERLATSVTLNKLRPERLLMRQVFGRESGGPGVGSVMLAALNLIMDRLGRSRLAGDPPDVYVIPRIGHIGLLDFAKAEELIALGREAMERELSVVRHAVTVLS